MRDIRRVLSDVPADFGASNFGQSSYIDDQGKEQPMYNVFQDGFVILVMGYTGAKAMQMKLAYIMAFNAMRDELSKPKRPRKALPAPMPEEDAGKWFRQVREDLQLALKILDSHTAAWFRLLQSGRTSQLHVMQQCNRHINRAQSGITTALAELREANRFARMLAESAGTGGHVVPLVKIGG
jgi:Rha family phage regulatory protein